MTSPWFADLQGLTLDEVEAKTRAMIDAYHAEVLDDLGPAAHAQLREAAIVKLRAMVALKAALPGSDVMH
jgi:hypothetical protein